MHYLGRAHIGDNPRFKKYRNRESIKESIGDKLSCLRNCENHAEQHLVILETLTVKSVEMNHKLEGLIRKLRDIEHSRKESQIAEYLILMQEIESLKREIKKVHVVFHRVREEYDRTDSNRKILIEELSGEIEEIHKGKRQKIADKDMLYRTQYSLCSPFVKEIIGYGVGHAQDETNFYYSIEQELDSEIKRAVAIAQHQTIRLNSILAQVSSTKLRYSTEYLTPLMDFSYGLAELGYPELGHVDRFNYPSYSKSELNKNHPFSMGDYYTGDKMYIGDREWHNIEGVWFGGEKYYNTKMIKPDGTEYSIRKEAPLHQTDELTPKVVTHDVPGGYSYSKVILKDGYGLTRERYSVGPHGELFPADEMTMYKSHERDFKKSLNKGRMLDFSNRYSPLSLF